VASGEAFGGDRWGSTAAPVSPFEHPGVTCGDASGSADLGSAQYDRYFCGRPARSLVIRSQAEISRQARGADGERRLAARRCSPDRRGTQGKTAATGRTDAEPERSSRRCRLA